MLEFSKFVLHLFSSYKKLLWKRVRAHRHTWVMRSLLRLFLSNRIFIICNGKATYSHTSWVLHVFINPFWSLMIIARRKTRFDDLNDQITMNRNILDYFWIYVWLIMCGNTQICKYRNYYLPSCLFKFFKSLDAGEIRLILQDILGVAHR